MVWKFEFLQFVFKKVTLTGLKNSLPQKGCKNSTCYFMILPPIFFQSIKIKLNSRAWRTLKSSDFPGLRTSMASMTSTASTTSMASMISTASFHQKITDLDGLIIPSTQMINTSPFLWNRSSKIQFFTDS